MYQYILLSYFILGAIKPDPQSLVSRVEELPGGWPTESYPHPDEVFFVKTLASGKPYRRYIDVAFIMSVAGFLAFTCVALFSVLPLGFVALVLISFGPVVTLTAAASWFLGFAAILVLIVNLVARYWLAIVSTCAEYVVQETGIEQLETHCANTAAACELHYAGRPPASFTWEGCVWSLASLRESTLPVSNRYAVATYWLYCPSRYERGSITFFAIGLIGLYVSKVSYFWLRKTLRLTYTAFRALLVLFILLLAGSDRLVFALGDIVSYLSVSIVWPILRYLMTGDFHSAVLFARMMWLLACLKALSLGHRLSILAARKSADVKGLTDKTVKWRALWNNAIMDFTRKLDVISVPNFIRSLPDRFDREAINEGQRILEELGWPASEPVVAEFNSEPANIDKFAEFIIGGTAIRQGILRAQLEVSAELSNLAGLAPEYKRTEQYATVEAELESLARYFTDPVGDFPELPIDDIWQMVGEIFENSQLTPFSYIIKKWEKKYGLGPFWGTTNKAGKFKKMSRRSFMKSLGSVGKFVQLWADTFYTAHLIPAPAPVSVKSEALPPKKWMAGKVRTIIGAPITHYISSTLWNYWPNHHFKFWSTGIKIGMPLNGANLSRLIRQHSTYDYHFAGDFSDFDSTLRGKILDLIARVRKKGFEKHRDYAKICFLIDANYIGLLNQPMMTTSTGNLYKKTSGLSTGHSSTGMDNSLAEQILYLLAWRDLTGLSAHEFRHYCKMSNYGDDHLMSWLATAPASWTPDNIIKSMARMHTALRDEFPKLDRDGNQITKTLNDYKTLDNLEFLSKVWRRPTANDVLEMQVAGLPIPEFVVIHNPSKLVGKAYAPAKTGTRNRDYRMKRLVGYMGLTAHQRDLYDKLYYDLQLIRTRKDGTLMPCPVPIPSYNEVLQTWYDENTHITEEDSHVPDDVFADPVLDYSLDGLADTLVNVLSVVPDVLNPAIYNMGYVNWLVSTFGSHVSWPIELIRRANSMTSPGALSALGKRTFYDFLFENPRVIAQDVKATDNELLFRHWLFVLLRPSPTTFNPFVFIQWADKKIAEVNFILNGYVQPFVKRFDVPFIDLLLIAGLDFVPAPPLPKWLTKVHIPAVGSIIEFVYGYVLNSIWSNVPANMKQSFSAIDHLSEESPCVLIEAPTGTGKSTTFVNYVWRNFRFRYNRVIVIVPRNLLVTTLTPYLQTAFNLPACAVTDGHPFDASYRLIVTTPNELLLHENWLQEGNLVLLDEAHLQEPAVIAVRDLLKATGQVHVMMTATPSAELLSDCSVHVPLQIASTWTIVDDTRPDLTCSVELVNERDYWYRYRAKILDILRTRTLSRVLVFVPNRNHARELAGRVNRRCCVLSAIDKVIDPTADIYIATAVADVGLTIPDVDWVITSDLTRTKDPETDKLLWTRTDALTLKQRRGRTGRTSNGLFTVVRFPRCLFVSEPPKWTEELVGLEVLRSTGQANLVVAIWPATIARILAIDLNQADADSFIDDFITNFEILAQVMEPDKQRTYRTTLDGVSETQHWHIAGNVIPTAIQGDDPWAGGVPLSIKAGWDFLVGAAHYATSAGTRLSPVGTTNYLRSHHVSDDSWKAWVKRPDNRDIFTMGGQTVNDPTGRFGKRTAVPAHLAKTEDNLFAGLSTFSDPKPISQLARPPPSRGGRMTSSQDQEEDDPRFRQARTNLFP